MFPLMGLVFMVIVLSLYFGSRNYPIQGGHYDEVEDLRRQIRELKEEIENLKKRSVWRPDMPIRPEDLMSRTEVEDAVIRMFVATDERDWPAVESCFTEPLTLDMTSMVGGSPATMTPRQVANAWAEGFKTLDHVHHQVGNFQTRVDGQRATVRCHGVAFQYRAGIAAAVKSRTFVGTYEIELSRHSDRWLINRLTFKLKFIDGNLELEKAA
jgi:hypothetical protein